MLEVLHSTLSRMKSSSTWKVKMVLGSLVVVGKRPAFNNCRWESGDPSQLQYITSQNCTPEVCIMVRKDLLSGTLRWGGGEKSTKSSGTQSPSSISSETSNSTWPPVRHGSPPCPRWSTNPAYYIYHYTSSNRMELTSLREESSKKVAFHCCTRWKGQSVCWFLQ